MAEKKQAGTPKKADSGQGPPLFEIGIDYQGCRLHEHPGGPSRRHSDQHIADDHSPRSRSGNRARLESAFTLPGAEYNHRVALRCRYAGWR